MDLSSDIQHTYLPDLPEELVEWIAEFLTSSSPALLQLRSTCRKMRADTERVVAREYFSDRTFFIYDEGSLRVLLKISQHPVFQKSMHRICFSLAQVPTYPVRRRQQRKLRRGWRPLLKAQSEFRRRNGDLQFLKDILTNFNDAGNTPALVATGEPFSSSNKINGFHENAWGYARFRRELGRSDCMLVESDRAFNILDDAIRETNHPITSLELGCEDFGIPISVFPFRPRDKSYANLQTLRLSIALERDFEGLYETRKERAGALAADLTCFLASAKCLKTLSLSCEKCTSFWVPDIIFVALTLAAIGPMRPKARGLKNLQVLELTRMELEIPRLLAFVEATRCTLKRLKMCHIFGPRPKDIEMSIRDAHGGKDFELDIDQCFQHEIDYDLVL